MRVSDAITLCAVFLGDMVDGQFRPTATGFIGRETHAPDISFQYVVTAAHCVMGRDCYVRLNTVDGKAEAHHIPAGCWTFHPDESQFTDVAVVQSAISAERFDFAHIALDKGPGVATPETIEEFEIGIGDEVFFPGLFVQHHGTGRNIPILRSGTIAAMPSEPINTRSGPLEAYLIEARSIGGHSGSPVFVNLAADRTFQRKRVSVQPRGYHLLGLIRGHLRTEDMPDSVGAFSTNDPFINSGIGTVIPATKILETINHPELVRQKMEAIKRHREKSADVPDAAHSKPAPTSDKNPQHKEDFTRLLSEAAKPKPKGGRT